MKIGVSINIFDEDDPRRHFTVELASDMLKHFLITDGPVRAHMEVGRAIYELMDALNSMPGPNSVDAENIMAERAKKLKTYKQVLLGDQIVYLVDHRDDGYSVIDKGTYDFIDIAIVKTSDLSVFEPGNSG